MAIQREGRARIKQNKKQNKASKNCGLIRWFNVFVIGIPKRENRAEEIFEEIITPNRTNTHTLRWLKAKENKEKILKAAREKRRTKIRMYTMPSLQKLCKLQNSGVTRSAGVQNRNPQPRILCPAKMSFRNEREIKTFSNKKSGELIAERSVLQETLKEVLRQRDYHTSRDLDLCKEI